MTFYGSLSTGVAGDLYEETNSFANWFLFFLNRKFNLNSCVKTWPFLIGSTIFFRMEVTFFLIVKVKPS